MEFEEFIYKNRYVMYAAYEECEIFMDWFELFYTQGYYDENCLIYGRFYLN